MKHILLHFAIVAISASAIGQNVGIGSTSFTPNASSLLEMRTTTSGFLMPRMTQAQRDAIVAPAEGLLVYQTNGAKGFKYFDGTAWVGADDLGNHTATSNILLNGNWLSNDGGNEGIRIANNGHVGIGTASPTEQLHVSALVGDAQILIEADPGNSDENSHPKLMLSQDGGSVTGWFGYETEASNDNNLFISNDWMNDAGDVRIRTQGINRMTVDGTGNVGIGTSNPARLLNVGSAVGAQMLFTREDNSTLSGDLLGELIFDSVDDTAPSTNDGSAVIRATASENHGNSNKGGEMSFLTKPSGTHMANPAVERMRITHNGNIGIGTSSPTANLHAAGSVRLQALSGTGNRMVVADINGNLATQAVPTQLWSESGPAVYRGSGNVGVGTASPDELLHVMAAVGDAHILISSDPGNTNDSSHPKLMLSQDGGSVTGWFGFETEGANDNNVFISNDWMNNAGDVRIRTQGTTRLTVDGTGNVGIGTLSPDATLHVVGDQRTTSDLTVGTNAAVPGDFRMMIRNETNYDGLLIKSGDNLGDIGLRIEDQDGSFNILDVEVDQGYFIFGDTYQNALATNGVVYGIDNQNDQINGASDFNSEFGVYRMAGEEITPYSIGGGIVKDEASSSAGSSTSSTSYTTISGMSRTPAAGTYLVTYSASGRGTSDNQEMQIGLFKAGSLIAHTERFYGYEADAANEDKRFSVHTQALVTVNGSQEIAVKYQTNFGTFNMYAGSVILMKVSN